MNTETYKDLFEFYPTDIHDLQKVEVDEAIDKMSDLLDNEEECWVPKEGAPARINIFGTYRTLQVAALMLQGPMIDEERAKGKLVTACQNPNCCNPHHIYVVNKRYALDEVLREVIARDPEFSWYEFRKNVKRLENLRATNVEELAARLGRTDLRPDIRAEVKAQLAHLNKRSDYAYLEAARKQVFGKGGTPICDRMVAYLQTRGVASPWSQISLKERTAIFDMLREDHPYAEDEYFKLALTCMGELLDSAEVRKVAELCSVSAFDFN